MYYSTIIYINYLPPVMGMINTIRSQGKEENKMYTQTEAEKTEAEKIAYNAGFKAGMRYMMDKKVRV